LHDFPRGLQSFLRPDGEFMDLAATDILRSRELGVPRYNQFRELLHLPRVESFEDLTENRRWAEELRRVYEDDIDQMDLMVGLLAEPKPKKFGFGDTTFRIFLVMTTRRLNSDPLFTTDYTPEVYTQVGLDYIDDNNLSKILLRHFPGLQPSLRGLKSAFAPWRWVGL
jgi:Animal haem peroxidase